MKQTMMAVRLFEHGGPEVLKYLDVPIPEVGADEVLIRVRATSINSWDLRYRAGALPPTLFQDGRLGRCRSSSAGTRPGRSSRPVRTSPTGTPVTGDPDGPHPRAASAPCAYGGSRTCASTLHTPVTRCSADTPNTSCVARTRSCPSPTASTSRQPQPPCGPTPPRSTAHATRPRRSRRHSGHHRRQRRNGHRMCPTGEPPRRHRHRDDHQGRP